MQRTGQYSYSDKKRFNHTEYCFLAANKTTCKEYEVLNITRFTKQQQQSDFHFSLSNENTNISKMSSNRGSCHTKTLLRNHNECRKVFKG